MLNKKVQEDVWPASTCFHLPATYFHSIEHTSRDLLLALVQRAHGVYQAKGEVLLQAQQRAVVLLEDLLRAVTHR